MIEFNDSGYVKARILALRKSIGILRHTIGNDADSRVIQAEYLEKYETKLAENIEDFESKYGCIDF